MCTGLPDPPALPHELKRVIGDGHDLLPRLRVRKAEAAVPVVDHVPGQVEHLVATHTGQREQTDRGD